MKDPLKMLRQVQQMQDRMQKMQKELESETVEATAGGGAVTVVATGTQKLVSVRIDRGVEEDLEMLQDLVVAAVNEASRKVEEALQAQLGGLTGGMKIPGLF